jgi:hypothetical protein
MTGRTRRPAAGRDDPSLAFGLLLVPARVARPITDQLSGRRFAELSCARAAVVLEGLIFLQWVRAAPVGAAGLALAYLTHALPSPGPQVGLAIAAVGSLWLPCYMLTLAPAQLALKRYGRTGNPPVDAKAAALAAIRLAPVLALVFAAVLGVLIV